MILPSKLNLTSLLFIGFLFLQGCAGEKSKQENNTIITAYRLIDEQRTDEAIELLETELNKKPDDYDFKAVLASAYAHKAGIKIQKLIAGINQVDKLKNYDFVPAKRMPKIKSEKNDKNSGENDQSKIKQSENAEELKSEELKSEELLQGEQMNVAAMNLAITLTHFTHVFETYASIPVIDGDGSVYLKHAIYLLDELKNKIKPEDALYKAVLEVILFKYILTERLIGDVDMLTDVEIKSCKIDVHTVSESVLELGKLLIKLYKDLAVANPKQANELQKLSVKTEDFIANVSSITSSITELNETSSTLIKKTAVQNGFGKLVQCGNN